MHTDVIMSCSLQYLPNQYRHHFILQLIFLRKLVPAFTLCTHVY